MHALRFVDSHAHLTAKEFDSDRDEVIGRALDTGVTRIVNPAVDLEDSRRAIELAEKHACVYAAIGFHPHQASKANETVLAEIEEMSSHPKVVAIGEIGLDYYYDFAPKEVQQRVFDFQLGIARRKELPVIIHTRESIDDTVRIVEEAVGADAIWRNTSDTPRGVYHCFSGDWSMAQRVLAKGFLISFPGIVTFKKPGFAVEVATKSPLENLLLETDSPYLSPVPHRGTRNEPSRIPAIASKIAELKQVSLGEVSVATNAASERMFDRFRNEGAKEH